jgi:hypothetical protein
MWIVPGRRTLGRPSAITAQQRQISIEIALIGNGSIFPLRAHKYSIAIHTYVGTEVFYAWAWRVPFLVSFLLEAIAIYISLQL